MRRSRVSSKSAPTPKVRGHDAAVPPAYAALHDLVVAYDARVREAVGQEQAAADCVARELLGHLLAAAPPATLEVGVAPRRDAGHGACRGIPRLGGGRTGRDDDVNLVVVRDDGEAVLVAQRADALEHGLARVLDLVAVHGARAVEDEREVDGQAARPRRGIGRLDLGAYEAAASFAGSSAAGGRHAGLGSRSLRTPAAKVTPHGAGQYPTPLQSDLCCPMAVRRSLSLNAPGIGGAAPQGGVSGYHYDVPSGPHGVEPGLPSEGRLMECLHCKGRMERGTAPFTVYCHGYHVRWERDQRVGVHAVRRAVLRSTRG